jgi:subtilase family serine protease
LWNDEEKLMNTKLMPLAAFAFGLIAIVQISCGRSGTGSSPVGVNNSSSYSQINGPVNVNDMVLIADGPPAWATNAIDAGPMEPTQPIGPFFLQLNMSAQHQNAISQFVAEQNNPASPNYMHWLTPQEYGDMCGASIADYNTVTAWLTSYGLTVYAQNSRLQIDFSGNVAQVENLFQTKIRNFQIDGKIYLANSTGIYIPRALYGLVGGPIELGNYTLAQIASPNPPPAR